MWYSEVDDQSTASVMFELEQHFAHRIGELSAKCAMGEMSQRELAERISDCRSFEREISFTISAVIEDQGFEYDSEVVSECSSRCMVELQRSAMPVVLSLSEDHSELVETESAHDLMKLAEIWLYRNESPTGDMSFYRLLGAHMSGRCDNPDLIRNCFKPGKLVDLILMK